MKAKNSKLTFGSTLCSLLLFFYFACADESNCCSFPTDDCSEMFRGTGITLECHQGVEFPREDGDCLPVATEHEKHTDGQIELVDVEIMYEVKCPSQFINEETHCERSSNLNYIGLNITFRITAGSVEGIQFNLQTVGGEVKPIVGTLKKSCHNLNFSGVLTADVAGDRLFSYTNYVGLHPNSQYNLMARASNNPNSDQLNVSIPDCRKMKNWAVKQKCDLTYDSLECDNFGKWYDDFFCSIPSPAAFTPEMWVYQNLSTKLTIWNGNPQLSSYVLILCNSISQCTLDEGLQTETVPIRSGQETLYHQFNVNLPAGSYSVVAYGQPDDICEADQHWGSLPCPSAGCTVELEEDVNHCSNPLFCQSEHSQCVVSDTEVAVATCECIEGFELNQTSGLCEDINECETASNLCGLGDHGNCSNTEGSAHCTCSKGYKSSRAGLKCEDINECETASNLCSLGGYGYCSNTEGSAHCICFKGYKSSRERLMCEDIDECETNSSMCGTNGLCINTIGGAYCSCSNGFQFNREKFKCEDINECETASNLCGRGVRGNCSNTEGSAHCICSKGFKSSRAGLKCEDINECATTSNLCGHGKYGYCNNTEGSAHCICFKGYKSSRAGLKCEEQISVWMIMLVAISGTVAVAAIITFMIYMMRKCCHYGDGKTIDDLKTVTSDSELAQFTPVSLIVEPPPHLRGPLESIEGGSEEPLMETCLRSM